MKQKHKITEAMFRGTMIVLIIAELSGAVTTIIDGIITSRFLGPDMMSAQGIASAYFPGISIISGILMVGCQALIVEAISKGKKEKARNILTMAAYIGVGLTLLITLLIWIMPDTIASLLGASKGGIETVRNVGDYLKGISLGAPFWLLFILLTPVVQLDGGGKYCTIASIVMGISDVAFDFIFGLLLDMKLFGMGLASGISHILAGLVLIIFMFTKKCTIKFNFKKPDFKSFGKVFVNGLPRALSMIGRTLGPILLNIIVLNIAINGTTSNVGMTALATQRNISFTVASIGWGIGGAILMIGTLYFNERNYSEFKTTLLISIRNILILVGGLTIILYFASPYITRIYIKDYESNYFLYETTLTAFKYYFLSLPFVALNVAFANYAQVIKKNILSNILNFVIESVALVLACYLLSINHGYKGYFLGFLVGQAALSLICVLVFVINLIVTKKKYNNNKYRKLLLPHDFIKEDTLVIEKNINSIEDAVKVSESISLLCSGTKLSSNQIYKLSLCVEEMCVNVFKHGFTKDNKKHNVMVRIIAEDEKVVLTLIDDCKMFDITKKLKSWEIDPERPEKNMGIRMIMLLAKEINYTNTMNINNLQIIL